MNHNKIINFFGKDAKFNHLGIAIKKINSFHSDLEVIHDKIQNVNISFVKCNDLVIELVEPVNKHSPINSYINKQQTFYHICFRVPDLNASIRRAKQFNFTKISKPVPAIAFNNKMIVWLYNTKIGLVELLEE